nr:hypothetical protein [Tanacetum cinerariifolium]
GEDDWLAQLEQALDEQTLGQVEARIGFAQSHTWTAVARLIYAAIEAMERSMLAIIFWLLVSLVVYTYVGYAGIVWLWASLKGKRTALLAGEFEPPVTVVVPAYNEAAILAAKVRNCLALNYPADRMQL